MGGRRPPRRPLKNRNPKVNTTSASKSPAHTRRRPQPTEANPGSSHQASNVPSHITHHTPSKQHRKEPLPGTSKSEKPAVAKSNSSQFKGHWPKLRKKNTKLRAVAENANEKFDKGLLQEPSRGSVISTNTGIVASLLTVGQVHSNPSTQPANLLEGDESVTANDKEDNRQDGYSNAAGFKSVIQDPEDAEDNRNVWSIEAFEPTPDRKYAKKLLTAFQPYMCVASLFGRFSLTYSFKKEGNIMFGFNICRFPCLTFVIASIFTMLIFFLVFFNIVGLMIKFPRTPDVGSKRSQLVRSEEIAIMKRNLVPLIVFLTNIIHLVLAQAAFFFKREYIARYFGYWAEVVELLRLDVANNLRWEMQKQLMILMLMFLWILGMHFSDCFSACNGGAAALTILLTRCFDPAVHLREDFYILTFIGKVIFCYIYISSKFYMIYFFFRCRLLKNLFIVWNRRFNICVNGEPGLARRMVRSTRAYLFKDHIVTLNLIEGANHEFVLVLESYLLCAMVSMVMELYHAVRAVGGSEFDENRQLDFIVLTSYLIFDFYIFFTSCLEAGYIPEQAKVAFDIVKRKGMMSNRADQELWFMLSMRISFDGCSGEQGVGITAGDFVYVTKTFILLAVGLMTSHFIIIYQFEMQLQQTSISDRNFNEINLTELVARVEGTRDVFGLMGI